MSEPTGKSMQPAHQTVSLHPIRLHGPWNCLGSSTAAEAIRFKVPGWVPMNQPPASDSSTLLILRRTWNRPPSGLKDGSKFSVFLDCNRQPLKVLCNSSELTAAEKQSNPVPFPGTCYYLPTAAVQSFNQLDLIFEVRSPGRIESNAIELTSVILAIHDPA